MLISKEKSFGKKILESLAAVFLALLIIITGAGRAFGEDGESVDEDEQKLEEKQDEIDDEIDELKEELTDAQGEKALAERKKLQISGELNSITNNIGVIEERIEEAEEELSRIELELDLKQKSIEEQKAQIGALIREIDRLGSEASLVLMENGNDFGGYFTMIDNLDVLERELQQVLERIKKEKEGIEASQEEQEKIREMHSDQKATLDLEKNKKSWLLGQAQKEVAIKEATIGEIQGKIGKLRSELSSLLGKGYDTDDIIDAAKFASKATGARKDFILGMLVVESDLGRYTGGCNYKESRMSSYRKELFKEICEELDYDYKKQKVSCPPRGYSGTGGAMGVAQFMSDTWNGYKSQIASATGHNPPDPWNLVDGVTAMAIKLSKVSGVTSHKRSGECNAAKLYLSGTTSSKYNWYCEKVLYWADNYEKLL